jgi:pimeloyl-ACP methyl ester carboxylesterase
MTPTRRVGGNVGCGLSRSALQGRFIDVAGYRTYYIDQGQGPVILLMHGASVAVDAWLTWHSTIAQLSRSFRVLAFDQPAFGRTDMPKDGRYLNRLQRTDHALAFLDALDVERAILIGHSEGGFMAARMAIVRPGLADKLVIVTSGGTAPRLGGDLDRDWMAASKAAYNYKGGADSEDGFIGTNAVLRRVADPAIEAMFRENYRRAQASGQIEMFRRRSAEESDIQRYTLLQEEHIHPYLSQLTMPALILWAADDPTVPVERGLRLARLFPKADFHVFSGAAHMVMFDRPEAFNRLLAGWCAGK